MTVQQYSLFDVKEFCPKRLKHKRVRFKKPTYTKSYKFFHINPDTNEIQYDGDERHIFRIKVLHCLYTRIYEFCNIDLFEQFEQKEIDGLIIWSEDRQAELNGTADLPIKYRVLLHLRLLKLLRKLHSDKNIVYGSLRSILNHRGFVLVNEKLKG